jgi:O-antigen ligase
MAAGGVAHSRAARLAQTDEPARALAVGLALLLLSGLAFWPWADEQFPMPKAALGAIGATVVLLAAARVSALPRVVAALVASGGAALLLAAATAPDPVLALVGRFPRYEGVAVVSAYLLALAAGARASAWWWRMERTTTAVLAAGVSAVVLVAVAQVVAPSTGERIGSLLGNATDLGVWCAMVALLLAPVALRGSRTATVAAVVAAVVTVWTSSRGALAALLAGLVLLLVAHRRDPRARRALLVAGGAVVAAVVLLPEARGRVLGTDTVASATGSGRWLLWSDTLRLVREHPLLGVGPSGFVDAIGSAHTARWAAEVGPLDPPDSPHTLPLQVASAGGLLLVLVVAALAVAVLVLGVRRVRTDRRLVGPAAAVAGGAAASLVAFTTPSTTMLLCTLVGVLVARPVTTGSGVARFAPGAVGVVVALALLASVAAETQIRTALDRLATGDTVGADSAWAAADRLRPGDADLLLRRGHAEVAAVDAGLVPAEACLPTTELAQRRLPTSSEAALDRARCLELNGRYAEARDVLARARVHDPASVDLVLLQGVLAAEAGDPEAAIALLRRAADLRPSASEPWTNLAVVYQQLGRTGLADEAAARARELGASG